jgi:tRNA threonylcarbamoyl adenosine modification protein (Sua5/YciO/YrdC/YwlC family)
MILKVGSPVPSPRIIDQAVAILQRGGLVAFPTDTGYAIGCDLYSKKSIDRIYFIKRRDRKKPLSVICADLKELSQFAVVSNRVYRDMRRLLPGPYTFVLPATRLVPKLLVSSRSSVGIRVPDNSIAQALITGLRHPIVGTSCATPEGEPLLDPAEIEKKYGKSIQLILDGGVVPSEPSTVIDFSVAEPIIIRKGKGDITQIADLSSEESAS